MRFGIVPDVAISIQIQVFQRVSIADADRDLRTDIPLLPAREASNLFFVDQGGLQQRNISGPIVASIQSRDHATIGVKMAEKSGAAQRRTERF
jgi:hypothetical protein